jgi:hypothetical protein
MKKTLLLCIVLLFNVAFLKSQNAVSEKSNFAKAGDHSFNLYYGASLVNSVFKGLAGSNATDITYKGFGNLGIMYEYIFAEGIGFGAELGYSKTTLAYNYTVEVPGTSKVENYTSNWQFTNLRAMMRFNFHFVKREQLDVYALMSMGYRKTIFTGKTNDPDGISGTAFPSVFPVGLKPGMGIRLFITKNIGINAELAIGTPIISGGLSFKF